MAAVKIGSFDLDFTQAGDEYVVSGKDAGALHTKMQEIPEEANEYIIGDLKEDGTFTLQKSAGEMPPVSVADSDAQTSTATAG